METFRHMVEKRLDLPFELVEMELLALIRKEISTPLKVFISVQILLDIAILWHFLH